jgi:hypothetical protein
MTPIAPSLATAEDSPEREIPIDIAPWIIGNLAVKSPILSDGNPLSVIVCPSPQHLAEFINIALYQVG